MSHKLSTTNEGLLSYRVTANPDPVHVSPDSGNPAAASLVIAVSNNTSHAIYCDKLTFSFPIGDLAQDLTSDSAGILVSVNPSDKWQIGITSDGVFTATPKSPSDNKITTDGLSFHIYNIQVNKQIGTFTFSIVEHSSVDNKKFSDKANSYDMAKLPDGFYVNNFAASAPMVDNGNPVTLTWSGSDLGSYTILYGAQSVDVTEVRSWTSPGITDTTTFALKASVQVEDGTVDNYLYVTVIVNQPEIKCTSLTAGSVIVSGNLTAQNIGVGTGANDIGANVSMINAPAGGAVQLCNAADASLGTVAIGGSAFSNYMLSVKYSGSTGCGIWVDAPDCWNAIATNGCISASAGFVGPGIVPVGCIIPFAGNGTNLPAGWLICDGRAISRTTYKTLYESIGVIYGKGDGSTTFNLPDYRGMFLRGVDHGAGNDPDSSSRSSQAGGTATGDNVGSRQDDEFKSHNHSYTSFPNSRGDIASGRYWQAGGSTTGATGGNETRPKNVYVNYLIRVL